ncbi:MAG TPA: hypothetical protein VLC06_13425 [Polyangia bacterium]|jgi:hypothetical protein|nr:hypothetical protein [Polyangia bacterium]
MARKLWGAFVFLLVLGSLGACGYLYTLLRQEQAARSAMEQQITGFGPRFDQFKEAVRDVDRRLSATVFQEVDLGVTGWQPITGGLYVIDLSTSSSGKGMKIAGKVINPTSVTHESAQISVRAGEHQATFTLPHLPPGVAEPFEVTLPEVPPASTHKVFFALDGSTINFSSSSTRKRAGGEPVDTDKLLH